MKLIGRLAVAGIVLLVLLQLVHPSIPSQSAIAEVNAPLEVRHILETHCYACHSDQPQLSWFDQIVPGYWLVRHDVLTAREHVNFSTLGAKSAAVQKATLYEAVNMMQLGAMPLPQFLALHPGARMKPEELDTLKAYLAPWSSPPGAADPHATETESAPPIALAAVRPEPGGQAFDPSFEDWKLISTTDRGDNYTLRLILGNDVAIEATRTGNISPWPKGARFAKIAWQQRMGDDGLVHPGPFIQVELMDKDADAYKSTDGWGWGRWRGMDLKPYGTDAGYTKECTGCHQPVHGNDYVYTLPISSALSSSPLAPKEIINFNARLPANLPYQPLSWNPITIYTDRQAHTISVLFGNPEAVGAIHPRSAAPVPANYPAGSVLALVTWVERDDPHWFGARIPDAPQSVEFVNVTAQGQPAGYRRFSGNPGAEVPSPANAAQRTELLLGLPPAALP